MVSPEVEHFPINERYTYIGLNSASPSETLQHGNGQLHLSVIKGLKHAVIWSFLRGRLGSQSVVGLEYTQTAAASLYRQCLHHVWFRSIPIVTKTLGGSPRWKHDIGHTRTSFFFLEC